jgi:hypothetical protein
MSETPLRYPAPRDDLRERFFRVALGMLSDIRTPAELSQLLRLPPDEVTELLEAPDRAELFTRTLAATALYFAADETKHPTEARTIAEAVADESLEQFHARLEERLEVASLLGADDDEIWRICHEELARAIGPDLITLSERGES